MLLNFMMNLILFLLEMGCGKNTYCVIEYNCFFKDKNGVYQYHTGKDKLEKLSYVPKSFTEESLLKLLNKKK